MAYRDSWGFAPYVTVAQKRARAAAAVARLRKQAGKKGRAPEPVTITGRRIATTFWGRAWCDNLESYADFAYRLDRGRSYVRAGAVVDLKIEAGEIEARVSGSDLYEIEISIDRLAAARWKKLAGACGGRVRSLVGLLRGQLPDEVMRAVTDRKEGLFPDPRQLRMQCSCPDWAGVCKHVAASLYGVGARLDARPELLFHLRGVDPQELIEHAADALTTAGQRAPAALEADGADLGALFGIELDTRPAEGIPPPLAKRGRRPTAKDRKDRSAAGRIKRR
jgi:uncharacterized Zn finger protein